ncbi:MAG: OsmC family protein [Leptospiraceae bacterium]|nr:OsmC family protein [Leptospiraceae bacterium]MCB1201233.1 OsmC family protein [Leptospiraceae bacterium]
MADHMTATATWDSDMVFTAANDQNLTVAMDVKNEQPKGPTPKEMVLMGLCGCTAMDVISILEKMRVKPAKFKVEASAELTTEHPKVFNKIHMKYHVSNEPPDDKMQRAVELSQNQYCGVSAMLKKSADVSWEIVRIES